MTQGKVHQDSWFQHEEENTSTSSSSIGVDSSLSSSSETDDDASSSNSSRALFDLSEIMSQLPIKRGLSKFYQGKSESFMSLSRATSIEDLAKKPDASTPHRKHLVHKTFSVGLDRYKPYIFPKAIVSKKMTKPSYPIGSFTGSKPPVIPPCKNSQC